jgi:DNA (cytosine-5)-methyltransferase 3A
MVALERAGIPVERYVAYEIDKYAIKVSEKNYPQIEHCGDVFDGDFTKYKGFDLLIGGSPCQHWSCAKGEKRETNPDGIGGNLFMQYIRALKESECPYFLYENNYSIHKDIKAFISEQLGVKPIMINSALVSAQQRKRCYWTNIPNVKQPDDKGVLLKDILESGQTPKEKGYCLTHIQGNTRDYFEKHHTNIVFEPIGTTDGKSFCLDASYYKGSNVELTLKKHRRTLVAESVKNGHFDKRGREQRIYSVKEKKICLTNYGNKEGVKTECYKINLPDGDYIVRKLTPIEAERLQTLPDNYTEGISNTQRYKCLGNGWTVDVIAHILRGLSNGR